MKIKYPEGCNYPQIFVMHELFSGSAVMSKAFQRYGFKTLTVDINPDVNPDICTDINDIEPGTLGYAHVYFAAPDCSCFSIASVDHHGYLDENGYYQPKSEKAKRSFKTLEHSRKIVDASGCQIQIWENPMAMMRVTKIMTDLEVVETGFCSNMRGLPRDKRCRKPTDIFKRGINLELNPPCSPGSNP